MALFYSSLPLSHDSVTASQHEQYRDPETEAVKWNSAIVFSYFVFSYLV